MSKRIVRVSVLTTSLVAVLGAGLYAHLQGEVKVGSTVIHVSSYDATFTYKSRNPTTKPSALFVSSLWTLIDTECTNPAGQIVLGQAALQVVVNSLAVPITPENVQADDKGRSTVTVHVDTAPETVIAQIGGNPCINPLWTLEDVLVREMVVTFETQECSDTTCTAHPNGPFVHYEYNPASIPDHNVNTTAAYVEIQSCVLPPGVQLPDPVSPVAYTCTPVREEHLD